MTKTKKEKKNKKKLEKLINSKKEKETFDLIYLLKTELYDSKPNMMMFLEKYCQSIRINNANNIQMYPSFEYAIDRIFIKFKNGSEIMRFKGTEGYKFVYTFDMIDVDLKEKENELVSKFVDYLFQFKIIH